jgi:hypothetical protein
MAVSVNCSGMVFVLDWTLFWKGNLRLDSIFRKSSNLGKEFEKVVLDWKAKVRDFLLSGVFEFPIGTPDFKVVKF